MAPKRNDAIVIPIQGPTLAATEDAAAVQRSVYGIAIHNEHGYENAAEALSEITREAKTLKAEMDATIRPINDGIKRIRALYKPALDSLTAAQGALKEHMLGYRARMEAHRQHEEKEARRQLAVGNHEKAMAHVAEATQDIPRVAGVSVRLIWKLRVVDVNAVPRQFLFVDMVALRKDAVTRAWENPPPGIEYFQEEMLASI